MIITITIITDNRLQVRSFPDTAGTAIWRAVSPSVQQNATLQQRLHNCRNCGAKKRPAIKYFQMPLVWPTKPSFIKVSSEISSIKNSEKQTSFRGLWKLCEPSVSMLRTVCSVRTVFRTILTENFYCLPTQHSLNNLGCISNFMHKILIYLHIIHLLKSSTCFEHYLAHLQEVYVVTVYMQPLVSSLSAGDCPVHRLRETHGQPIITTR